KARVPAPVAQPTPRVQDAAAVEMWLRNQVAAKTKTEPAGIDRRAPFAQFGLDSLDAVRLSGELGAWLHCRLSPTVIYDYPSIAALAAHLNQHGFDVELVPKRRLPNHGLFFARRAAGGGPGRTVYHGPGAHMAPPAK
ncbi:MAG: acyl carrier protein, partial [bacterium]|nr:acyl carrier protein [bacterium]